MALPPLPTDQLFHRCDPNRFDFKTTAELEELSEIIGQDRAVEAVRFGVDIHREGYNLFVMGPPGMGKHTLIKQMLQGQEEVRDGPFDWCYVNNFELGHKPLALKLPRGKGQDLKEKMEHVIEELSTSLPAAFESDEYRVHAQSIEEAFKEQQERTFNELSEEAAEHDIKLFRTPSGFAFAPIEEGEVVGPEAFSQWPEDKRKHVEEVVEVLQEKLQRLIQQIPVWRRDMRERLTELNKEVALSVIGHLVDDIKETYADIEAVTAYLDALKEDVLENVGDFLKGDESGETIPGQQENDPRDLHRYKVNVLVDNSNCDEVPIIYNDNPTYMNLVGRAEHIAQFGTLITDFTLLKPGALHQANGGYLIVDAHKLLTHTYAWEGLKRALYANEIRIESLEKVLSLGSTISLEPEPIPLDVKIIIVGDRHLYYLLHEYDQDFAELFKVVADFEDEIKRDDEGHRLYARLIATLTRKEELLPFDRSAVARIIEYGARLVEDNERLTTHMRSIADLLREADYWARQIKRELVCDDDVQKAIDQQTYRLSRVKERVHEEIHRNTVFIDTSGECIGQINGLSVLAMGDHSFGQPSRITTTVHIGEGDVIDIEREVDLGGPLHSKGVLILNSFIAARYAQAHPLSLSASIVFEQSYGGIDGDSASLAELCCLLSAIARVPIRQSIAMTGSVNQHGHVQPIGGANEKIEGFFDICIERGLTGEQGVIIPHANVKHLMLRRDVVEACEEGRFHIWAVQQVDEALELLTGIDAGHCDSEGKYPEQSLNGKVQHRLTEMALIRQHFGDKDKDKDDDDDDKGDHEDKNA